MVPWGCTSTRTAIEWPLPKVWDGTWYFRGFPEFWGMVLTSVGVESRVRVPGPDEEALQINPDEDTS